MRILFDQNVPLGVRKLLRKAGHEVVTSPELEWEELKNGRLLRAAEEAGFGVMVTADKSVKYQQNLSNRKIALVVLGSNNWPIVRKYLERIVIAVDLAQPNTYAQIEMPLPSRPA